MYHPESSAGFGRHLAAERLSAAIERGDKIAARNYLDDMIRDDSQAMTLREAIERGRFSRAARPAEMSDAWGEALRRAAE